MLHSFTEHVLIGFLCESICIVVMAPACCTKHVIECNGTQTLLIGWTSDARTSGYIDAEVVNVSIVCYKASVLGRCVSFLKKYWPI